MHIGAKMHPGGTYIKIETLTKIGISPILFANGMMTRQPVGRISANEIAMLFICDHDENQSHAIAP